MPKTSPRQTGDSHDERDTAAEPDNRDGRDDPHVAGHDGLPSLPVAFSTDDGPSARQLPAELRARPPRRITLPPLGGVLVICLLLMPHTLIGLGTVGYAAFSVARGVAGTTVPATVQRVWNTRSKNSVHHHAQVELVMDGLRVDKEVGAQASTQVGDVMRVRHLGGAGVVEESRATREVFLVPLFALFWCGIVGTFWLLLLGRRLLARWLLINGSAVVGRVTTVRGGKTTTADVHFVAPGGGAMVLASPVEQARRSDVHVGMQVPVLMHPQKPHLALAHGISVDAWWARPAQRTR